MGDRESLHDVQSERQAEQDGDEPVTQGSVEERQHPERYREVCDAPVHAQTAKLLAESPRVVQQRMPPPRKQHRDHCEDHAPHREVAGVRDLVDEAIEGREQRGLELLAHRRLVETEHQDTGEHVPPPRDRVAGEHDLLGDAGADQTRQALRAAGPRQQTQLDFRLSHLRIRRHDAHVARHAHFHAAAQRQAVDGCQRRLAQALDGAQAGMQPTGQLLGPARRQQAGKFLDVKAGAEGPLAVAGDDGHPHLRVVGQPGEARRQFLHHLRVQHVQRRIGERNDGQRAFLVQANHLPIGNHVGLLSGPYQVVWSRR